METHIYVECSSKTPQHSERFLMYVVDYHQDGKQAVDRRGEPIVYKGRGRKTCTWLEGIITALAGAMVSVGMEGNVCVYTSSTFAANMINCNLDKWIRSGYQKADGTPISQQKHWQTIGGVAEKTKLEAFAGKHTYYNWMLEQMRKWEKP